MNATQPIRPEKESSPTFEAVGVRSDASQPLTWYVLARIGNGPASEVANCEGREAEAKRIAFSLNTVGRMLVGGAEPYFLDDIAAIGEALGRVSSQCQLRSIQAMGMGETETGLLFGAEARAIAAGAMMLDRVTSEVLKFLLVGDTIDAQAEAWVNSIAPNAGGEERFNLLNSYRAGMIAGQMAAAQGAPRPVQ